MDGGRRYWAFLSYSHEDRDWANWLHRALETYAIPKALIGGTGLAGPAPRRLRPIFKDREELAASADLRDRVHAALAGSSALIVICSPAAARSSWVEDEIVRFKALRGEARVFAVIVAGAPGASRRKGREEEECFPAALLFHVNSAGVLTDERADLIAADLRAAGDGRKLAKLKLVAGILGVDLDDLVRRDAHRRARRLTALTAASAVGALAMGALTLAALASRNEAQAQRAQAEGLVGFMLGDLRDKLEPLGRLDVLDAVGQRAMAYYNAQAAHGLDDEALGRRATVLHLLGEIQEKRGNLQDALREFKEASATTAELLTGRPDDGERVFNHAQSVYYVSEVADQRGEDQEALREALEYKRLAERLVVIDPKRGQEEVADANSDIGSLLLKNNRAPEALAFFRRALDVTQSLANKSPRDHDLQMELAQIHAWLSDAEIAAGELDAAIKDRLAEGQICRALLQKAPDDNAAEEDLVVNRTALGRLYARTGRLGDSIDELARAANEAERLMAVDRSNTEYQESAVVAFTALGESLMRRRSMAAAREAARRADTLAESLVSKDSTVNNWSGRQLGAARVLLMRVAVQAASDAGSCRQALAPAPRESARIEQLVFRRPNDLLLSRVAGEAAILEGDYEAVMGRPDRARTAWTKAEVNLAKSTAHGRSDAYDYASGALSQAQARLKRSATSGLQTTTASLGPIWNAARGPCAPAYADW